MPTKTAAFTRQAKFASVLLGLVLLAAAAALATPARAATVYTTEAGPAPVAVKEGAYIIHSLADDNFVLDVYHNSNKKGANLDVYKANATDAQTFNVELVDQSGPWYTIRNAKTGMAIDVCDGNKATKANIWMYPLNKTPAQQWEFIPSPNGKGYVIRSKLGTCLNLAWEHSKVANYTNVWTYREDKTLACDWSLEPAVAPASLKLNRTAIAFKAIGQTTQLKATLAPKNANWNTSVSYSSSNPSVATVDQQGKVKAAGGGGSATITARSANGKVGKAIVKVPVEVAVQHRLDRIANGSLRYNSNTIMALGKTFSGTRASERCKGYATNCFYLCFKVTAGKVQPKKQKKNHLLYPTKGMTLVGSYRNMTAAQAKRLFSKARPGDYAQMRRYYGGFHSAIVYAVSANGITLLEANTDGHNTVKKCFYTWSELANKKRNANKPGGNHSMSLYTATSYNLR